MIERIAKDLGLDTLQYQRLADMVQDIRLPEDELCLYCWNGKKVDS